MLICFIRYILFQTQEVKHLVEHGERWGGSTAYILRRLLRRVNFKRLDSFPKLI